jgi:hypothetical protein
LDAFPFKPQSRVGRSGAVLQASGTGGALLILLYYLVPNTPASRLSPLGALARVGSGRPALCVFAAGLLAFVTVWACLPRHRGSERAVALWIATGLYVLAFLIPAAVAPPGSVMGLNSVQVLAATTAGLLAARLAGGGPRALALVSAVGALDCVSRVQSGWAPPGRLTAAAGGEPTEGDQMAYAARHGQPPHTPSPILPLKGA